MERGQGMVGRRRGGARARRRLSSVSPGRWLPLPGDAAPTRGGTPSQALGDPPAELPTALVVVRPDLPATNSARAAATRADQRRSHGLSVGASETRGL